MRAFVLVAVLAACSYPEKELIDAGTPFGCANAPAPTKADNPSVISGTVLQANTSTPVIGASVVGQFVGGTSSFATLTTDQAGHFRTSQNTGGIAQEIYLTIMANVYSPTYYY